MNALAGRKLYKSEPGEPYSRAIALNHDVVGLNPRFRSCRGILFKAYDPPRTLVPANVLTPVTTRGANLNLLQ